MLSKTKILVAMALAITTIQTTIPTTTIAAGKVMKNGFKVTNVKQQVNKGYTSYTRKFTVKFDRPVSGVTVKNVVIKDLKGRVTPVTLSVDRTKKQVIVTPKKSFNYGTIYSFSLNNILDSTKTRLVRPYTYVVYYPKDFAPKPSPIESKSIPKVVSGTEGKVTLNADNYNTSYIFKFNVPVDSAIAEIKRVNDCAGSDYGVDTTYTLDKTKTVLTVSPKKGYLDYNLHYYINVQGYIASKKKYTSMYKCTMPYRTHGFDKLAEPHYVPNDLAHSDEYNYWRDKFNKDRASYNLKYEMPHAQDYDKCNTAICGTANIEIATSQKYIDTNGNVIGYGAVDDNDYAVLKQYIDGIRPLVFKYEDWYNKTCVLADSTTELIYQGKFDEAYKVLNQVKANIEATGFSSATDLINYYNSWYSSVMSIIYKADRNTQSGTYVPHSYTEPVKLRTN